MSKSKDEFADIMDLKVLGPVKKLYTLPDKGIDHNGPTLIGPKYDWFRGELIGFYKFCIRNYMNRERNFDEINAKIRGFTVGIFPGEFEEKERENFHRVLINRFLSLLK